MLKSFKIWLLETLQAGNYWVGLALSLPSFLFFSISDMCEQALNASEDNSVNEGENE